jgi:plastin-1
MFLQAYAYVSDFQLQGSARKVENLHSDLKDGEVYLRVLHSIGGSKCPIEVLSNPDATARAETVITNAQAIEVPTFIQAGDITSGNRRLNLAFMAQVFNANHGLDVAEDELKKIEEAFESAGVSDEGEDDAREERVFRLWMNSLNLGDGTQVHDLFDDLQGKSSIFSCAPVVMRLVCIILRCRRHHLDRHHQQGAPRPRGREARKS